MKSKASFQNLFSVAVLLFAACDNTREQDAPDAGTSALVLTTDYTSGAYSIINLSNRAVSKAVQVIHQDAVCRFDAATGLPFIIARLGADAIDVLNPQEKWKVRSEYSVEAGSNAQDIALVSKERAYVARLGKPQLLIVHPTTGTELGRVDLSAYADADGLPEAAWVYHMNGEVFVLLQRLKTFKPTSHSTLVILDGATGAVKKALHLTATNPVGKLRYSKAVKRLVIIEAASLGTLEGGIEYLNPEDHTLSGLLITEKELGGDMVDAVIASSTKGYAVIAVTKQEKSATHIVSFNPSTGKKLGDILTSDAWVYSFLELNPDGSELWVTDRTMNAPGIRIFKVSDDSEVTSKPIDVGLPPSMVCFVQ